MKCFLCEKETEAVKNIGPIRGLCHECYDKEKTTIEANAPKYAEEQKEVLKLQSREHYFNLENADLALITGTAFERATKIKERIDDFAVKLFDIKSRSEAAFVELQKLASELRAEEKAKLKIQDISYNPTNQSAPAKPRITQRMSKEDKAMSQMVQAIFGWKIRAGQITENDALEQVKAMVRQGRNIAFTKIASGELKCSCNETPGICKIHQKE